MADLPSRVTDLFARALSRIETRSTGQPNAWERYRLFEALAFLEARDLKSAAIALDQVTSTPEVSDLEAVWRTPYLTLAEIRQHFDRVRWGLMRA